jgi:hypothetical protein
MRFEIAAVRICFVAQQSKTAMSRNEDSEEHSQPHGGIVFNV